MSGSNPVLIVENGKPVVNGNIHILRSVVWLQVLDIKRTEQHLSDLFHMRDTPVNHALLILSIKGPHGPSLI